MQRIKVSSEVIFTGLAAAVVNRELSRSKARGRARLQMSYYTATRPRRLARVGFVILPLLWSLYTVAFIVSWKLGNSAGPVVGFACLLFFLAGALLNTVRQLKWAWTGDVE
jgi:hypothetical protein